MDTRTFLVQGSAPAPYVVTVSREGDNLTATCTCQAAVNGLICKHRLRILQGVMDGVVGDRSDDVVAVRAWLVGTDVEGAIQAVVVAESELEAAKNAVSLAKRKLGRVLSD